MGGREEMDDATRIESSSANNHQQITLHNFSLLFNTRAVALLSLKFVKCSPENKDYLSGPLQLPKLTMQRGGNRCRMTP